jgi:hypothetical protein
MADDRRWKERKWLEGKWLEGKWSSHEGMDEQDSGIYRPCILFTNQSGCEVPMQQMQKHSLWGQEDVDTAALQVWFLARLWGVDALVDEDITNMDTPSVVAYDSKVKLFFSIIISRKVQIIHGKDGLWNT